MDIDDVAGELYARPPKEFTAARKAKVAEARRAGDRQLADDIGQLRRPTASAAIVNLLTRTRDDLIDDLLELADELRHAQRSFAGDDLRRLSARRTTIVAALVEEGRRLAADQHNPLTAAVESELTATLQAALADPEAAELVRSGRLTSALRYSGFGMPSGAAETAPPQRRRLGLAKPRLTMAPRPSDEGAESRRADLGAAQEAVAAARSRLDEVQQAATRAGESVAAMLARRQEAAERITAAERLLSQARDDERQAAKELRLLERDRDRAVRAAAAARQRMEQAQQVLDRRAGR